MIDRAVEAKTAVQANSVLDDDGDATGKRIDGHCTVIKEDMTIVENLYIDIPFAQERASSSPSNASSVVGRHGVSQEKKTQSCEGLQKNLIMRGWKSTNLDFSAIKARTSRRYDEQDVGMVLLAKI